jgi:mannose-6-phosphate isomerase-like protein (cupin superfamily)
MNEVVIFSSWIPGREVCIVLIMKTSVNKIESFVTRDGSRIRELIHPACQEGAAMSLAEATIRHGSTTLVHIHRKSQEIYHITQGNGMMTLGGERFEVRQGDSILIMPGVPHCIENIGTRALKILCICHPAYDHQDTHIL